MVVPIPNCTLILRFLKRAHHEYKIQTVHCSVRFSLPALHIQTKKRIAFALDPTVRTRKTNSEEEEEIEIKKLKEDKGERGLHASPLTSRKTLRMHLKKSEDQIGEESIGFSADFRPPHLLQIHISNPSSNYGFSLQSSQISSVHGLPPASTPHKRPVMNHPTAAAAKTATHCRPISAVRVPTSSPPRILLRLPFSSATRSALRHLLHRIRFRLRLVFLLSFPSLYFLLVTLCSSPPSPPSSSSGRSFLLDFLSAVAFSSAILFLLFVSLNLFSLSSLRLLLSRSSSLLPRYHRITPPSVQWSIGSTIEKPKSGIGTASGFSVQLYSNGDVFEGEFHKGKCSGSGVYYYYMSGRYEGDWVDNKYDGYGIETWARGSRYKGQYRQGLRHGFGVYRFYTGDVYAGEWSNGHSHGYGLHTCKDGSRYIGGFKCGIKHGLGHYHFR